MSTDQDIEQEIQAKGADVAPRVTLPQIDALMARVSYIGGRLCQSTSTVVHAFLDGDFLLATGHSACVSPDNFNADLGFELAKSDAQKKARDQLWLLEGYALRKLLRSELPTSTPNSALPPIGDGPRRNLVVTVSVPENWESRLDMQWVLEREIHSDRWSWTWPPTIETADKA